MAVTFLFSCLIDFHVTQSLLLSFDRGGNNNLSSLSKFCVKLVFLKSLGNCTQLSCRVYQIHINYFFLTESASIYQLRIAYSFSIAYKNLIIPNLIDHQKLKIIQGISFTGNKDRFESP